MFGILWKRIWRNYFIKLLHLSQMDKSEKNRHRLWKLRAVLHAKLKNFWFVSQKKLFNSRISYKNYKLFDWLWKRIWRNYFIKLRHLSQKDKSEKKQASSLKSARDTARQTKQFLIPPTTFNFWDDTLRKKIWIHLIRIKENLKFPLWWSFCWF